MRFVLTFIFLISFSGKSFANLAMWAMIYDQFKDLEQRQCPWSSGIKNIGEHSFRDCVECSRMSGTESLERVNREISRNGITQNTVLASYFIMSLDKIEKELLGVIKSEAIFSRHINEYITEKGKPPDSRGKTYHSDVENLFTALNQFHATKNLYELNEPFCEKETVKIEEEGLDGGYSRDQIKDDCIEEKERELNGVITHLHYSHPHLSSFAIEQRVSKIRRKDYQVRPLVGSTGFDFLKIFKNESFKKRNKLNKKLAEIRKLKDYLNTSPVNFAHNFRLCNSMRKVSTDSEACVPFIDPEGPATKILTLAMSENISNEEGLLFTHTAQCELQNFFAKKEYNQDFENFIRDVISVPLGFGVGSLVARASSLGRIARVGISVASEFALTAAIDVPAFQQENSRCESYQEKMELASLRDQEDKYQENKSRYEECENGIILMTLMSLTVPLAATVGSLTTPSKTLLKKINGDDMLELASSLRPASYQGRPLSGSEKFLVDEYVRLSRQLQIPDHKIKETLRNMGDGCNE